MSTFFHTPLLADVMLAALVLELVIVAWLRRAQFAIALSAALPGAFLIVLLGCALSGSAWFISAACALGALLAHLADLRRRGVL